MSNLFKRIGALLLAMMIVVGTCVGDAGIVLAKSTYTVFLSGSHIVFRDSDDNVVNQVRVAKGSDLELHVTADAGYELPDSINFITYGVDRYYNKSEGKIKLSNICFTTYLNVDAVESKTDTVEAYLYYRYSNTLPNPIVEAETNKKYGPNGNGVSSTKVTVDLAKLRELGYAKGKYIGKGYIYSVENKDNDEDKYEKPAHHNNKDGSLKQDSKVRDFWDALYSCMDDASQRLVDEVYGGKYLGYVLKDTLIGPYRIHIDGILDSSVSTSKPVYQVEVYDNSGASSLLAKTKVDETKATFSDVYTMVEEYLSADAQEFSIEWQDATTATYVKDGKSYSLTISQTTPEGSTLADEATVSVDYDKIDSNYYLAMFEITSKRISMTCNLNVHYNGELVQSFESGDVKSVDAETVAKYADVQEYVEQLLIGEAENSTKSWVNWEQGIYVKDGNLYTFSMETVSPTESKDGCIVMPVIDEEGIVYYSSADASNDYISNISIEDEAKNATAVGLYVLKKEASNLVYGYDVDSDSIIQHPTSDFNKFGYAYLDNDYLKSLKKGTNSTLFGESITESLYSYDYEDNSFEAAGEKFETGKILQYFAFNTNAAKNLVTKINDDYNIMWYVVKKAGANNDPYTWHIDGYLCKDESKNDKIKVTVTHKLYNRTTGEYEDINDGANTITEEVPISKLYTSKSIYPKKKDANSTKITIDGSYTDWADLPSYWVPAEYNKTVSVNSNDASADEYSLENYNQVKMYNDDENQNVYIYMKASDVYDTYFRTDDFQLSVNNGDFEFNFSLGDAQGNIINGDISNMAPGAYDYYIYDKQGNRISGGNAKLVIGTNHFNTSVEMSVPYDVITTDSDDRYFVTGMEKISGTVIAELSNCYYDDEECLINDSQLAFEDTELEYRYASIRTVESIQFKTINIEGTSTAPYVIVLICFGIVVAGFAGVTYTNKHSTGRN